MKPEEAARAPAIRVENVGVKYSHRFARKRKDPIWPLRDVSFEVNHGEIMGVIGRNGAGKTTLLRVVAGILEPDKGRIFVDGLAALLALATGFIMTLSGRDNIILGGMMLGVSRRHMEAISEEIIDFSELKNVIDLPVAIYSTGMRARLGFSVALYTSPEIVLLDETLGVGDAWFQRKSTDALEKMISDSRTVLITSHSADVLRKLCSRVVWIEQGKVQAIGPATEVVDEYLETVRSRQVLPGT
jgi:lipopolysaccharide transport system ATP-binding protein